MNLSFDKIVLTTAEQLFLDNLYCSPSWVHERFIPEGLEVYHLLQLGLIEENVSNDDAFYLISDLGVRYYLYSTQNKDKLFYANLRSWIAILISVVALFVK